MKMQTPEQWAAQHEVSLVVLLERMKRADMSTAKSARHTPAQYLAAWLGDLDEAKTREAMARAELRELELEEARGRLWSADKLRDEYMSVLRIVHSRIENLPVVWAMRCNPAHPDVAKAALENAAEEILRPLYEEKPQN
jgi:hypothetical protein